MRLSWGVSFLENYHDPDFDLIFSKISSGGIDICIKEFNFKFKIQNSKRKFKKKNNFSKAADSLIKGEGVRWV